MGSEARLIEILNVFYESLASDLMLGFFFSGRDVRQIAQKQALFMLKAMAKPVALPVKPPHMAHLELPPILEGHFNRRIVILKRTLESQGLKEKAIQTWVSFESLFKDQIVKS
ncbi:MAG: hypothetical protein IT289_12035 [Oligoflexia bacterium]|nr:hypothetical protein [Oligoflexia bacterium]